MLNISPDAEIFMPYDDDHSTEEMLRGVLMNLPDLLARYERILWAIAEKIDLIETHVGVMD